MSFYQISPDLAKELKAGAFLKSPEGLGDQGLKVKASDNGDDPIKTWRETFTIRDMLVTQDGAEEIVRVDLTVPSDVISVNQGRTASVFFHFPWEEAEAGEKKAQTRVSINFRQLTDLLAGAGYDGTLSSLDKIPVDVLRNTRVNGQVKLGPDNDGVMRQNLGYWRAPK